MAVKIRLARRGRKKKPFYHIVVADARAPRDGRFIEKLGTYNPLTVPATIEIDRDRAYYWMTQGAQPTDTARAILKLKGVMYKMHLMRGVKKGAFSEEVAEQKYQDWIAEKDAKLAKRYEAFLAEKAAFHKKVSGTAPAKPKKVVEAEAAAKEEHAPTTEEPKSFADSVEQTIIGEETPTPEPVKEEAPAPIGEKTSAPKPVKEEAPAPVVEETPAPEPVKEEAPAPVVEETPAPKSGEKITLPNGKKVKMDDLTFVEGIGPKISQLLIDDGITTWAKLGETDTEKIKEILAAAGSRYTMHDPGTWPRQAAMAAKNDWDALLKWQDELDGGKEVKKD